MYHLRDTSAISTFFTLIKIGVTDYNCPRHVEGHPHEGQGQLASERTEGAAGGDCDDQVVLIPPILFLSHSSGTIT